MADKKEDSYNDIINQPHYISKSRPHMTMKQRASQFSPFIPQEGYYDAVKETARLTDVKIELGEDLKELLNRKLNILQNREGQNPKITVTYFQPDIRKGGGTYVTFTGCVEKVDVRQGVIYIEDGIKIPIGEIAGIEGEIFACLEGYAD
ncbi:MAG: hypothetical protein K2G19_05265 [Lachnospiraceae bacterium]|nr:hypothetical protein [Lachnospiraceae bacterium]